ncbi:hypothetical protein ATI61_11999 [Archangium gephyra]|uniref:Lipoprotein n=1 Tax=Archangium gephyra TaxID=48 RepID=A0AAC8QAA7_9BACT|nr:hypothetical protein [Archangium gephyra]AKJ03650.1 Hypothetical protein AA314_05276 [Archangium gephyra]REG22569.1 hypothetical protein ATI61_11999 [Archangium gephyra]
MRSAMRWLSVVGGLSFSWALPAMAEGTPVDCGGVDCEGIREMKALYEAQVSFLQETDRYSLNLAEVGFAPPACADGSRAPVPGPGWVAGCRFAYRMTAATSVPEPSSFTAMAQGAAGTPADGVKLLIGKPSWDKIVFTLERGGVRRYVGWDECLPAASFTCDAQLREGIQHMRALYTTERGFLQEKDRYSSNLEEIGFVPMGCTDGTRAAVPDSSWTGGCRFIYRVDVQGTAPTMTFTATARAISGPIAGTTIKIDESGVLTLTPAYGMCQ